MKGSGTVVIGFANSKGQISKKILEEDYNVVERLAFRVEISNPRVKAKVLPSIDFDIFKNLIFQRRNQALLTSFLGLNNNVNVQDLYKLKNDAKSELRNIEEELKTLSMFSEDMKLVKFAKEVKCSDRQAEEYLTQFNNNLDLAINKFKERQVIIKRFAQKNQMPQAEAIQFLKVNKWNASLFD